jgi:hypothetical protein
MSRRSHAPDAHVELRSRNESVGAAGKHGTTPAARSKVSRLLQIDG